VVAQIHGLGPLQMRVAGHRPIEVGLGECDDRLAQPLQRLGRSLRVGPHEHRRIGGDLVVAGACGVELAADRPGDLGYPPLDRHVYVLVLLGEREAPVLELALDPVLDADDRLVEGCLRVADVRAEARLDLAAGELAPSAREEPAVVALGERLVDETVDVDPDLGLLRAQPEVTAPVDEDDRTLQHLELGVQPGARLVGAHPADRDPAHVDPLGDHVALRPVVAVRCRRHPAEGDEDDDRGDQQPLVPEGATDPAARRRPRILDPVHHVSN